MIKVTQAHRDILAGLFDDLDTTLQIRRDALAIRRIIREQHEQNAAMTAKK